VHVWSVNEAAASRDIARPYRGDGTNGPTRAPDELGTDCTWHLRDLGVIHRQTPRGYPQANGKDEFSPRVIFRTPAELTQKLRKRRSGTDPTDGAERHATLREKGR